MKILSPSEKEEKKKKREKSLAEEWKNSTLSNDFIFHKLMLQEPDILKEIVELLLDKKVKNVVCHTLEQVMIAGHESKSVRLDVYLEDEEKMVNLEMQVKDQRNLEKRVRYYGSMMDAHFLQKNREYNHLPDRYVVFLCTFDGAGNGLARNTYQYRNDESGEPFQDGTYIYVYNTFGDKYKLNRKVVAFLDFVNGIVSNDPFIQRLEEKVQEIKSEDRWRIEYMKYELELMDIRYEVEVEAREREEKLKREKREVEREKREAEREKREAEREKREAEWKLLERMKETARALIGTLSVEKIADITKLSPEEILAL